MKNKTILSFVLLAYHFQAISSCVLKNPALKALDEIGLFDSAIFDILRVRQSIKELATGKFMWNGAQLSLQVFDKNKNQLDTPLNLLVKRPEALFGATFAIINPNNINLFKFVTEDQKDNVIKFTQEIESTPLVHRYENPNFKIVPTGTFIKNPMTQEMIPLFVGDYNLEGYDTRISHAHIAIPAHNSKDFYVAQQNKLPIKLVINSTKEGKNSSAQINKTTKELMAPYQGEYSDCIIINSDFLNGSLRTAHQKAIAFLENQKIGKEYKAPILYHFAHKDCSFQELQSLEKTLEKELKIMSQHQKEQFLILMIQAQSDLISIVEQFLINIKEVKELMIELIEESCSLRNNHNAYLLKWAHTQSNESEKVIFKRDITSFQSLYQYCLELVDFLGDFASSCPLALENLKQFKNKDKK